MKISQSVEQVTVTPELAREWLGYNTHNRRLRDRVVQAYATDMENGAWQWNGESVKFAEDGTLLDGQHRLAAIAQAGVSLPMLVVRGLPNQTQDTVDGGAKRKFSDVLQLRGEGNSSTVAAVVRRVAMWEAGSRRGKTLVPTNSQMLATLEKYPVIRDLSLSANQVARNCGLPASIVGFAMWLLGQIDQEDAEYFFARLGDGQDLKKGHPIYELRRTVEDTRSVRGSRSEVYLTAITIKAWNAFRAGNEIALLRFKIGGASPEKFPEPQ